jgi:hypothetical protein
MRLETNERPHFYGDDALPSADGGRIGLGAVIADS